MPGRFDAIPTKADLLAAATKVVQSEVAPEATPLAPAIQIQNQPSGCCPQ